MLTQDVKRIKEAEKAAKKAKNKQPDPEQLELLEKAKDLGLKPHPNTGIEKLTIMIKEFEDKKEK